MKRARFAAGLGAAALAVAALRLATRARVPDGWDSVGFARAVERFDPAAFQPHFPGYPVYVALTQAAHAVGLSPLDAATTISALASAATALALWRLGAALAGRRAGWIALALWAGALQPWLIGGAALSDATATALAAIAFAALTWPGARAALLGAAAMALAVGTRASYWPLALSFAALVARWRPADRRAAAVGGALATSAWLLPLIAVVGARPLWALGRTQLAGHFSDWGGAVTTRPDLSVRGHAFLRDLAYDGLWPQPAVLLLALTTLTILVVLERPRPSPRARASAAVVVAPYALWALLAQNVIEQPRHLLPLVAAAALAVGCLAARRPLVGAALALGALGAATPLMIARVRVAPAAAQLAHHLAAAHPVRNDAVVFAMRAARLMHEVEPSLHVESRERVSEVLGALERFDVLPRHIYVTSELAADDDAHVAPDAQDAHVAMTAAGGADNRLQFCRDGRLDRQSPCLTLRSYNLQP